MDSQSPEEPSSPESSPSVTQVAKQWLENKARSTIQFISEHKATTAGAAALEAFMIGSTIAFGAAGRTEVAVLFGLGAAAGAIEIVNIARTGRSSIL